MHIINKTADHIGFAGSVLGALFAFVATLFAVAILVKSNQGTEQVFTMLRGGVNTSATVVVFANTIALASIAVYKRTAVLPVSYRRTTFAIVVVTLWTAIIWFVSNL